MDEVAVPDWNDADLQAICKHMSILAFDLDNTLARSKRPMNEAMAERIAKLTHLVNIAVVTGGKMALVESQVLAMLANKDVRYEALHVMPTSGARYYRWIDGDWRCIYAHNLTDEQRQRATESLERHAREQGIWEEHPWGDRIEDRGSQITFSALGQQAPSHAKEVWDPGNVKKAKLVASVAPDIPDLTVRSGGFTSVDISLSGVDKAYAVRALAEQTHTSVASIAFVGDRMDPGGNDYPAALAGAMALRVQGPEDTLTLCDELISWCSAIR